MKKTCDNEFAVCPLCKSENVQCLDNRKWKCSDCEFTLYNNVATAVGLILVFENEKTGSKSILCIKRGREPQKGLYALPGGFTDPDESAEEACVREGLEETGLEIKSLNYICSAPNSYEYKGFLYKTCDMFFEANTDAKEHDLKELLHPEDADEITDYKLFPVNSEEDIDNIPYAFDSAFVATKKWFRSK